MKDELTEAHEPEHPAEAEDNEKVAAAERQRDEAEHDPERVTRERDRP